MKFNFFAWTLGIFLFLGISAQAQIKIGDNPTTVDPNSLLELESTDKGVILPRVALVQTTNFAPMTAHVQGMFVYNTATSMDVIPGIYFNDGTKWNQLISGADLDGSETIVQGIGMVTVTGTGTAADPYIVSALEMDGDATNELQDLVLTADSLKLTNSSVAIALPAGPAGPAGADGAVGPQGPAGPAGADGADGADGAVGPQGPAGPAGADGADGADGLSAFEVWKSETNNTTATVSDYLADIKGADGADGADGAVGPQGPAGPAGPAGADGSDAPADGDAWAVTGEDITTDIVRNGSTKVQFAGSSNGVAMSAPVSNRAGLLEFFDPDGTRNGFIGWLTNTMYYATEKNIHQFGPNAAKVGIGVNPTATLDVSGDLRIRTLPAGSTTDKVLTADTDGNVRELTITDIHDGDAWGVTDEDINSNIYRVGNVNIGSNMNQGKLNVYSGDGNTIAAFRGSAASSEIVLKDLNSANWPASLSNLGTTSDGLLIEAPQSSSLIFKSRGNDATDGFHFLDHDGHHIMTLNDNERVGIGTNSPTQKLHVVGNIYATGSITQNSDIRLKKNITPVSQALNKVLQLEGVNWNWIDPLTHGATAETVEAGVIAQDVQKVMPELIQENADGILSVNYSGLNAYLINAIKEQQEIIEGQQALLGELMQEIKEIKAQLK